MPASRTTTIALAALTAAAITATVHRLHRLRRALDAERAARRLTDGLHHRDMEAFTLRLSRAVHAGRALAEADMVLTSALTAHHTHPEGGTPT